MIDDSELLRRYAETGAEDAFAELVRRRLGLVYHAALRQCGGDAHRAEDVAQAVFTDLARQAARLARRPALTGWLYTSTRYAAAQAVRGEVRRQVREREAQAMNDAASDLSPEAAAEWERLRPVIDEVLHLLSERDREAVLMRFFEGRAFAEIGAKLALSEDAARMRVDRALEKLRIALGRRGVTSTTAALSLALASQVGAVAPAGVAASITGAALTGAAGGAGIAATVFMSMTKLKIGIAAAVLAAGAVGFVAQRRETGRLQDELAAGRAQSQEVGRVRAENERLTQAQLASEAELTRLRKEVAAAKTRPSAAPVTTAPAGKSSADGKPALATGMKSAAEFGRGDRSTPHATLESILTATNGGDNVALSALMTPLPAAQTKLAEIFAKLPEGKQAEYGSADQLLALLIAGSTPVAGMQVTGDRPGARGADFDPALANDPGYRTLHVQEQYVDGRVRERDMVFQQTPAGWNWVAPVALVTKMAEMLKPVPANLRHDGGALPPKK